MTQCALADKKKGRPGMVPLKNLKDFGRKLQVRTIVKGKRNQGTLGPNSVNDVGRKSLEHTQNTQRLYPENPKPRQVQNKSRNH